jgi:TonB family protein
VIKYDDFDLQIEPAGEKYRVRLLNAPTGQATSEFTLPFTDIEVSNFLNRIGQVRRTMRRVDAPELQAAKEFGGKLFSAVFSGEMIAQLRGSMEQASDKEHGLRIRLRLTDVPALADLPWEFLYDANQNHFLTTSSETPVVRFLDLPQRIAPLRVALPLRVLVVIASPRNLKRLDTEGEWNRLHDSLEYLLHSGQIVLERLPSATLDALRLRARGTPFHVFHFIGHGGFDEVAQDGVLQFEDESGMSYPVRGELLGMHLHDHRSLRLSVLNACEGARSSRQDPFSGVAQSLLQQRVPAVIAMQFEISDAAAKVFAQDFYRAVAEGNPVDAAVCEARKALFKEEFGQEWATPVLYMRSQEGQLFDLQPVTLPPLADNDLLKREKAEVERLAAERAEAERKVAEKTEAERAARERQEREKTEHERLARAKADAARQAAEKVEAARVASRKAEAERAVRAENARQEFEKAAEERMARAKADAERSEAVRFAAEQAEAERILREKKERQERERAEQERAARAKAKADAEKLAAKQAEAARLAAEMAEKKRLEKEASDRALLARQSEEAERRTKEQAAYERLQRERAIVDRLARDRAEMQGHAFHPQRDKLLGLSLRVWFALVTIPVIGLAAWLVHDHLSRVASLKNPESHYAKGETLRAQKNFGGAIAEYREAIRLKPDYAAAHAGLGLALSDNGDLENAIAEFRNVIRANPNDSAARNQLALTLMKRGYLDSAITEYRESVRLNPQDAETHYALANALEKEGDSDGALAEYRETLRLKPDFGATHPMPPLPTLEKNENLAASGIPASVSAPKKNPPSRIRQGGIVQAGKLIRRVQPGYPPLATQAHVSGKVRLHAIIAKDGTVREVDVLSGHPLLVQSAMNAVKQWVYRPTLLNGQPVEVDTTIDVDFKLSAIASTVASETTAPTTSAATGNPPSGTTLPAINTACTFGKIEYSEQGNRLVGMVPYTYQGSYALEAVALRGIPLKKDKQQIPGLSYQQSTLKTASGTVPFAVEAHPTLNHQQEKSDLLLIAIVVKQSGTIVCSEVVPYQRSW